MENIFWTCFQRQPSLSHLQFCPKHIVSIWQATRFQKPCRILQGFRQIYCRNYMIIRTFANNIRIFEKDFKDVEIAIVTSNKHRNNCNFPIPGWCTDGTLQTKWLVIIYADLSFFVIIIDHFPLAKSLGRQCSNVSVGSHNKLIETYRYEVLTAWIAYDHNN